MTTISKNAMLEIGNYGTKLLLLKQVRVGIPVKQTCNRFVVLFGITSPVYFLFFLGSLGYFWALLYRQVEYTWGCSYGNVFLLKISTTHDDGSKDSKEIFIPRKRSVLETTK